MNYKQHSSMQRPSTPDFSTHPPVTIGGSLFYPFRRTEPVQVVNNPVTSIYGFVIPSLDQTYIPPQTIHSFEATFTPNLASSSGKTPRPSPMKKFWANRKPRDEFGRFIITK